MATSINTNSSAMIAQNNLRTSSAAAQTSISRLSSGNKITRASDDVAALSIGTILRTDVATLKTALNNASQGITLLQVADGALARVGEILQRQKSLAAQALSGTLGTTERGYLDQEFQALSAELNRIANTTNFNGVNLIDGNLLSGGGTIVTQEATAANITAELTDTSDTINSTILANGVDALEVTDNGSADNSTLLKLLGSLSTATVAIIGSAGADDNATLTITINGVTFSTAVDVLDLNAAETNTLTANDGSGVQITIDTVAYAGGTSASATEITTAEDNIQAELRKLSLYQEKAISTTSTEVGSIVAADVEGTVLEGLNGDSIQVRAKSGFNADPATKTSDTDSTFKLTGPSLSNFRIVSHSSTSASFYIDVDGVTYAARTATVSADVSAANQDYGTDADGNALDDGDAGALRLYNLNDLQSYVDIELEDINDGVGLTTQASADAFAEAFNKVLGSGKSGGASFAVGTASSDTITVSIDSVKTDKLYIDENDVLQALDVTSVENATTASDVLDLAIQRVTSVRASVGSLQSRFGYASATLETSITNLDAARGAFLDADISAESTSFANNQVLTQAAISVLAQANQLPQNLLKLIQ